MRVRDPVATQQLLRRTFNAWRSHTLDFLDCPRSRRNQSARKHKAMRSRRLQGGEEKQAMRSNDFHMVDGYQVLRRIFNAQRSRFGFVLDCPRS